MEILKEILAYGIVGLYERRGRVYKEKFYTKNLKSFIDYARRQASKYGIKGSRINAVLLVLEILKKEEPSKKMRAVWNQLPRVEHCYDVASDPNGMRQYQVCGKSFQESATIGYVIPILEKFYSDCGRRAKLAAENKNNEKSYCKRTK